MVMRRTLSQVMDRQSGAKKEFFSSKYSLRKVVNLEAGMDVYCIPLNLDNGFYELAIHNLKKKGKKGFKGSLFNTAIVCKGIKDDGSKDETALCCKLAQEEYDKYPDSNDFEKRMLGFTTYKTYLPVLVLANGSPSKDAKKYPPTKLTLKGCQFAYIEMSSSTFNSDFLAPFIEQLKNDGKVDYECEGEELQAQVMEHLKRTVIKVSASETKKNLPYERSYSFISFDNTSLGRDTDQYQYIIQYTRVKQIANAIVDFITLFDAEIDTIPMSWTNEELEQYIKEDCERAEKVKKAVEEGEMQQAMDNMMNFTAPKATPKAEQVVTMKDDEVIGNEEEIPFGDDMDFGPIEEPVAKVAKADPIDDSMLSLGEDEDFFTLETDGFDTDEDQ